MGENTETILQETSRINGVSQLCELAAYFEFVQGTLQFFVKNNFPILREIVSLVAGRTVQALGFS